MRFIANSRSRLSTSSGRKSLGVCLSLSFILITIIVVSSVWSTQWKSRVQDDLPSVLSDLGNTNNNDIPTPSPTAQVPEEEAMLTPVVDTSVGCNGLESLCRLPLQQVLFATVHNAAAIQGVITGFPNHERNLLEALEYGYRGINLDIGKCENGEFRLVHGSCQFGTASLTEGLQNITNFVRQNPNQVILMPTQLNFETGGEFTMQELADYIEVNIPEFRNFLYQHDGSDTWPTLRQLIDADTPILFFHYNGESCRNTNACPIGLQHDWFSYAAESGFTFETANDILTDEACEVTRGDAATSSFYGINMFPRVPSLSVCDTVNNAVRSHVSRCTATIGRQVTAVLVDCWDRGTVLQDIQALNELVGNGEFQ